MAPWFRRKRFGWGWTPISWEGWVVTLLVTGACVSLWSPELVHLDKATRAVCVVALIAGLIAVASATTERET